jgi:hypothetical protein
MRALLNLVPLAGCGLMMAACMGLMSRGRSRQTSSEHPADQAAEIDALRREVAELRAERDRG